VFSVVGELPEELELDAGGVGVDGEEDAVAVTVAVTAASAVGEVLVLQLLPTHWQVILEPCHSQAVPARQY
jgi:hypothetical protein